MLLDSDRCLTFTCRCRMTPQGRTFNELVSRVVALALFSLDTQCTKATDGSTEQRRERNNSLTMQHSETRGHTPVAT